MDESIADLVADARASTPSNCAELLTRDRFEEIKNTEAKRLHIRSRILSAMTEIYQHSRNNFTSIGQKLGSTVYELDAHYLSAFERIGSRLRSCINEYESRSKTTMRDLRRLLHTQLNLAEQKLISLRKVLESCNPEKVLSQGYAILRGKVSPGETLEITTKAQLIEAKITKLTERS